MTVWPGSAPSIVRFCTVPETLSSSRELSVESGTKVEAQPVGFPLTRKPANVSGYVLAPSTMVFAPLSAAEQSPLPFPLTVEIASRNEHCPSPAVSSSVVVVTLMVAAWAGAAASRPTMNAMPSTVLAHISLPIVPRPVQWSRGSGFLSDFALGA